MAALPSSRQPRTPTASPNPVFTLSGLPAKAVRDDADLTTPTNRTPGPDGDGQFNGRRDERSSPNPLTASSDKFNSRSCTERPAVS
jgi:hypothetical protein